MVAEAKKVYTLEEFAEILGWDTRRTERLLRANNVPLHPSGESVKRQRWVVTLAGIKLSFPELWDSILEHAALERACGATADEEG